MPKATPPPSSTSPRGESVRAAAAESLGALAKALRGAEGRSFHDAASARAALLHTILAITVALLAEGRGALGDPSLGPLALELRARRRRRGQVGAWDRVLARLDDVRALGLFDPPPRETLEGRLDDAAVLSVLEPLTCVEGVWLDLGSLDAEHLGTVHEGLCDLEVDPVTLAPAPGLGRRRAGAHYTSRALTRLVVDRVLGPLIPEGAPASAVLALRVCDPAMGSGAFLLETCRALAEHLDGGPASAASLRAVASTCLHGVDKDPLAVALARASLRLLALAPGEPLCRVDESLLAGDALVGLGIADEPVAPSREAADRALGAILDAPDRRAARLALKAVDRALHEAGGDAEPPHRLFHWPLELPAIAARGGFDVVIGNPPWVAYAGRAAQPLAPGVRRYHELRSRSFSGYRTIQALFVERAAQLLRPGGRLGLVLPTSMSDLAGYAPARLSHDELAVPDPELPDFGDRAFDGVFQPSMALVSTRRAARVHLEAASPWPLERADLDPRAQALLERLGRLPRLPPSLFGERGFQTMGDGADTLRALTEPTGDFTVALRVGGDVEPFRRKPPGTFCDPRALGPRLRPENDWRKVAVLIRQTARFPVAALSDGGAFRNSILAGFASDEHPATLLVAYLSSTLARWFHYLSHRDARQGMPQVKIAHLRALPDPSARAGSGEATHALIRLGEVLGARNDGLTEAEQEAIDGAASAALGLDDTERALVVSWRGRMTGDQR